MPPLGDFVATNRRYTEVSQPRQYPFRCDISIVEQGLCSFEFALQLVK